MLRQRRGWVALTALIATVLVVVFAAPPLARHFALSKARDRGFNAQIADVDFGGTRVWLKDVQLQHAKLPQLNATLPLIEVRLGWFEVRAVVVHGGHVKLEGSRSELVDRLQELRRTKEGTTTSAGGGLQLQVEGLFLEWQPDADEAYFGWGVSYERAGAFVKLQADLVRVAHPLGRLESKALRLEIKRPELSLEHISASETEGTIDLTQVLRLLSQKPEQSDAPASDDDAQKDADNPDNEPPPLDEPQKTPTGADSKLLGVLSLNPERGPRVRARLAKLTGMLARRLPESSQVDLSGVRLKLVREGSSLNIGPGRLRMSRSDSVLAGSFVPDFQGQAGVQGMSLGFKASLADGPFEVKLAGGPIHLAQLGVQEGDFGLTQVGRTELELETVLSLSGDGSTADFSSTGKISGLSVWQPRLAPEPMLDLELQWQGSGQAALDGSHVALTESKLSVGAVSINLDLDVKREQQRVVLGLSAHVPLASCQSMFDSLPDAFKGELKGTEFDGTFSWKLNIFADTDQLDKLKARWRMQNDCIVKRVPLEVAPERFKAPFARMVPNAEGEFVEIMSGPGTDDWVPIQEVSRYLEIAVTVTEDRGFWGHKGFDQRAIESSIRQNVQEGSFVRGASTISMQLAKNLYLSRKKNIARKVQEALLTMLLEQELRKDEILELYFNVIEFGPGLYGIGPAAHHYFESDPIELSAAQCFYLASLLPSPSVSHFKKDGMLNERWARYIRRLLKIAHQRERITDAELEAALAEELEFGVPHKPEVTLPGSGIPGSDGATPPVHAPLPVLPP